MAEPYHIEPQLRLLDSKIDRALMALETLAELRIENNHLIEQLRDTRIWVKDHEARIQLLEKAPGSAASRFLWIMLGTAIASSGSAVVAIIIIWFKGAP